MDAYHVAFRIPNLLRDLFAEGAMSAAFVPTFTGYLTDAREGRRRGASATNVITALIVVTGAARACSASSSRIRSCVCWPTTGTRRMPAEARQLTIRSRADHAAVAAVHRRCGGA